MTTDFNAKYLAHELTRRCPSDSMERLASVLADAQVDLNPHQAEAALFAFRNPFSKGAILADEVGLGKIVEAGLLLSQHWAERKRRLLVIVPANLRKQWSQELADKFFLPTVLLEKRSFDEAVRSGNLNPFEQPAIVICSYHFVRTKEPYVKRTAWDLVVIDEAHRLRNVYKGSSRIAVAVKDAVAERPKVLLTATPLQNSLLELYGMVSIIDDFAFGDVKSFKTRFARTTDGNFAELKERLKPLCKRTLRRQVLQYIKYTNRLPLVQEFTPYPEEQQLYDLVSEYLQQPALYALPASQRQLVTLVLRKLLASSTRAISGGGCGRGDQSAVLQPGGELRPAVESAADRAAHRTLPSLRPAREAGAAACGVSVGDEALRGRPGVRAGQTGDRPAERRPARRDQPPDGAANDGRKVILDPMATDLTPREPEEPADEQPGKLDLRSMDLTAEKREALLRLFPEAWTEGGKIDFDRLRLALGETVDTGRERYGMTWPGKAECFRTIQTPSLGTLLPSREESVEFDTTENLIIEGDNLEVLKLLQKSYLGKVKMIYIDPPYNTGNDFIYPDDYTESLRTYLEYTGQVDAEGKRFGTNADSDGRFHSKWMNMMYPRLYLARNLLREDGLIFVSIDDREAINLRQILETVFGEENFVEQIVWKNKYNAGALTVGFSNIHEYIICFSRNPISELSTSLDDEAVAEYKNRDSKFGTRGGFVTQPLATSSKDARPNLRYPITIGGKEIWPEKQWIWSRDRMEEAIARGEVVVNETSGKFSVRGKQYLRDEQGNLRKTKPLSIFVGPYNQVGSKEIHDLFGFAAFDFPKPSTLIRSLLSIGVNANTGKDDIVLDFFAGSGSTAQAMLDQNRLDGGTRKFILVQLPQPSEVGDFKTIADITKERVRRVIKKLNDEDAGKLDLSAGQKQDRGFRVFKLAESNFKTWQADAPKEPAKLAEQLELHVEHIRAGRGQEDILFEILMKSGYPLTARVETLTLEGKTVFSVAEGALLVCMERELSMEVIRAMAARKPERVVCLDEGFSGNDQLKANAVQIFKTLHQRGDEAGTSSDVTVFRTV